MPSKNPNFRNLRQKTELKHVLSRELKINILKVGIRQTLGNKNSYISSGSPILVDLLAVSYHLHFFL